MPQRKTVFVYGYEPSGHSIAARALSQYISENRKPLFINLSAIYPSIGPLLASAYFKLVQKTPALWGYFYDSRYLSAAHKNLRAIIPGIFFNRLKKILSDRDIDLVISTHAFASLMVSRMHIGLSHIRRACIITDIYPHSFWDDKADAYFAPCKFSEKILKQRFSQEKVFCFGMPVRKEFTETRKEEFQLKKNGVPVFLITGGNRGFMSLEEIKKAFLKTGKKAHLNVMCAENERIRRGANQIGNLTFSYIPYRQDPSYLYASCDCVIGKPGGLTIFETAAFEKPFIAHSPLPGQEERNLSYLVKSQKCFFAKDNGELYALIELFYKNRKAFSLRAQRLASLSKPSAAAEIMRKLDCRD